MPELEQHDDVIGRECRSKKPLIGIAGAPLSHCIC